MNYIGYAHFLGFGRYAPYAQNWARASAIGRLCNLASTLFGVPSKFFMVPIFSMVPSKNCKYCVSLVGNVFHTTYSTSKHMSILRRSAVREAIPTIFPRVLYDLGKFSFIPQDRKIIFQQNVVVYLDKVYVDASNG